MPVGSNRQSSGSGNRPGQDEWQRREIYCTCNKPSRLIEPTCQRAAIYGLTRHHGAPVEPS